MGHNNKCLAILTELGDNVIFNYRVALSLPKLFRRINEIIPQLKRMGADSLFLIAITSAFTGLVTAVQASYQTKGYIPVNLISVMIGKSMMIELAPVLTALVLSGKIGAAIAAEIGSMRVSEQIDALESMGIDPIEYLYLPRIAAGILILPILTVYSNIIGIFSAYFVSKFHYNVNFFTFFNNMKHYFQPTDLWGGIVKSIFFGMVITSIGCYIGNKAKGGAEGVGEVATLTVVYSSILILIMDFVVAAILFGGHK